VVGWLDERISYPAENRYFEVLRREIADGKRVLDVGCGQAPPVLKAGIHPECFVGVDVHTPSLRQARNTWPDAAFVAASTREMHMLFRPKSFDVVVALDFIEHLPKDQGMAFLDLAERLASERVVIFTPNGFLKQKPYDGNPWQEHISGYSVNEMQARGYRVIGVNGFKPLRGERAKPRFRPYSIVKRLSLLTVPFVEERPRLAFQLLCVLDLT
jgi:SAM-dependent methyltransferase